MHSRPSRVAYGPAATGARQYQCRNRRYAYQAAYAHKTANECGVMRYGAVRFRCPGCGGHDVFVAFSCKRRGCQNCDAKRSAIITGQALERLLAFVPYRQWVLAVSKRLRYFLNHDPALAGGLSRIFAEGINRFLCQNTAGTPDEQCQLDPRFDYEAIGRLIRIAPGRLKRIAPGRLKRIAPDTAWT